ncbi:MAG: D-alanyl-D-alanine carboxypeptidase [Clostridia bacterium]|nr:D-alanyl-D-alanine carboxypeptidase [Clostridia bacterium]
MKKRSFSSRVIAFLLCFLCVGQAMCFSTAAEEQKNISLPQVSGASSVFLYHYESNQILLKRSGLTQIAPASTVKIMTGLLAIEKLHDRLNETVEITVDMLTGIEGYTIKLEPEMSVTVRDLLYGVICAGGNDAAHALAIVCSGSVNHFVDEMNQMALSIGCQNTTYANPSGMDDTNMITTLDDTILLAKKARENELFMTIASAVNYTFSTGKKQITVYNRNAMISSFSAAGYQNRYVKGMNAGMTDRGGYCAIAFAEHENNSYLCIVMGAIERNGTIMSYSIANTLLNFIFHHYSYRLLASAGTKICTAPVELSLPQSGQEESGVDCVLDRDVYGFLPNEISPDTITYRTFFHHPQLLAPVTKGTVVGGVDLYYDGTYITTAKLLAEDDCPSNGLLRTIHDMQELILSRFSLIFLVSLVFLLSSYFIFFEWHPRRRTRKK